MNSRPYHNYNWLYKKYVSDGLSTEQVGKICGVNFVTIWCWLKRFGIKTRRSGPREGVTAGASNPMFGKKASVKTKSLMSISHKGDRNSMFGKKHKPESIAIMRKKSTGVVPNQETRKKISRAFKGKNHWNWKGGITKLSQAIRCSMEYTEWRMRVFERDTFSCQECGASGVPLEAHHTPIMFSELLRKFGIKKPEQAQGCQELWGTSLGVTLCKPCHEKKRKRA